MKRLLEYVGLIKTKFLVYFGNVQSGHVLHATRTYTCPEYIST